MTSRLTPDEPADNKGDVRDGSAYNGLKKGGLLASCGGGRLWWTLLLLVAVGGSSLALAMRSCSKRKDAGRKKGSVTSMVADPDLRERVGKRLEAFRKESRELPSCPLVFPLLDGRGKITPLGSYLSCLAMKQASYLPEAVFSLSNVGSVFHEFELFSATAFPVQSMYRKELPLRFNTKDFCEGTCTAENNGYLISLRFWGKRPEKRFSQYFEKDNLNQAATWMAKRLHEWMGIQPSATQVAFMANPVFTSTKDLLRGAGLERLLQTDPSLVCRWDEILDNNPDSSFLFDRWFVIARWRSYPILLETMAARFRKSPRDPFCRGDYRRELSRVKRFEEAFSLLMEDLSLDDNNSQLYREGVELLQKMACHEESTQLLEIWRKKHPDNQESLICLAEAYRAYAWVARGTGFAITVTPEGWRLMHQRMAKAIEAAEAASKVGPQDCRTWATLLAMGNGASLGKEIMASYFNKVLELNPYYYPAYASYLNYLKPKWFGSSTEVHSFIDSHAERFPVLVYDAVVEDFLVRDRPEDEAGKRAKLAKEAENIRHSPHLAKFEHRMRTYLRAYPHHISLWRKYLYWMVKVGKRDELLAFAKDVLAKAGGEMAMVYPTVVLEALNSEAALCVNDEELEKLENRGDVIELRHQALQALLEMEPLNWEAMNRLAKSNYRLGRFTEAKSVFGRIGENWTSSVWEKEEFEKARAACLEAGK